MRHQEDTDGLDRMNHRQKRTVKKLTQNHPESESMTEVSKLEIKDKQTLKRKKSCPIIKQS